MFRRFVPRFARPNPRSWKYSKFVGLGAMSMCTLTTTAALFGGSKAPFDYKAVRKDVEHLLDDDITRGPILVRLAWHEAGTWDATKKDGCPNDASMRFAPECNHGANAGLKLARDLLEAIKAKHPQISYADLWSLAACVAIEHMGGPQIGWRWGREDAKPGTTAPDGRLPDASKGQSHIRDVFYRMGFNDREAVALIGAHTLGECHADRSGYVGPWTFDKVGFDNSFYSLLLENDWIVNKGHQNLQFTDSKTRKLMMLPADIALILDPSFNKIVKEYADNQDKWHKDFAKAFQKLMELGVHDLKSV